MSNDEEIDSSIDCHSGDTHTMMQATHYQYFTNQLYEQCTAM